MTPQLKQIGIIHTPFNEPTGAPIQSVYAGGIAGTVEVFAPFVDGLADLEGFDRIWLLYWCDRTTEPGMRVVPYRDNRERGLFATRAPARPNPIGLSCVKLLGVEKSILTVTEIDVLNGTPLLDIKPYVPLFDSFPAARAGWHDQTTSTRTTADDRFHSDDTD